VGTGVEVGAGVAGTAQADNTKAPAIPVTSIFFVSIALSSECQRASKGFCESLSEHLQRVCKGCIKIHLLGTEKLIKLSLEKREESVSLY
jgi:hypothetical protein